MRSATLYDQKYVDTRVFEQVPLVSTMGNVNATAYSDILDNSVLPVLWQQLRDWPFLVSTWQQCPCEKSQVHKEISICVWRGGTWPACTELGPQPHLTPLGWTETQTVSQALSAHISVGLTIMLLWLNGSKSPQPGSKITQEASPEEWRL